MRPQVRGTVAGLVLCLTAAGPAAAADERVIRVFSGDFAPYIEATKKGPKGPIVRLLRALGDRANVAFQIEVLPWARAQRVVRRTNDPAMIVPLTRAEHRNDAYTWVVPLVADPLALVSTDPAIADKSFADVRQLRVAVKAGSTNAEFLKQRNFAEIDTVRSEATAARLLKLGRVDAWLARPLVARAEYERVGGDPETLVVGPTAETRPMYLAAAKDSFDSAIIMHLRAVFRDLRRSGTYQEILHGES